LFEVFSKLYAGNLIGLTTRARARQNGLSVQHDDRPFFVNGYSIQRLALSPSTGATGLDAAYGIAPLLARVRAQADTSICQRSMDPPWFE